jgi:hypothetical protein
MRRLLTSGLDDASQKRASSAGISFGSVIYHSPVPFAKILKL